MWQPSHQATAEQHVRFCQQIEEEERLMQELKKIEQRKKEREKKTLDLQKLITAADSNIEARRPERKTTKKAVVCKVKDTNVSYRCYSRAAKTSNNNDEWL